MVFGKKDVNDTVEKSKIVTRGGVEGSGIYSCTAGSHDGEPFTCSSVDKEAIAEHLRSSKHYQQGSDLCAVCGQSVDMNVILTRAGNKPLHPECRGEPEEL